MMPKTKASAPHGLSPVRYLRRAEKWSEPMERDHDGFLQGMGWGYLPSYLIERELRERRLISIAGKYFQGGQAELVGARRRDAPHGPIAEKLWRFIGEEVREGRMASSE